MSEEKKHITEVLFRPRKESLKVYFKIYSEDIPRLIQDLIKHYNHMKINDI